MRASSSSLLMASPKISGSVKSLKALRTAIQPPIAQVAKLNDQRWRFPELPGHRECWSFIYKLLGCKAGKCDRNEIGGAKHAAAIGSGVKRAIGRSDDAQHIGPGDPVTDFGPALAAVGRAPHAVIAGKRIWI